MLLLVGGAAARGLVRLAVKGLKDKVPQVYSSCLGLFQVGGRKFHEGLTLKEVPDSLLLFVLLLMSPAGHLTCQQA